jgi:DNA (cytosine-5)-methyltransferase 1
MGHRTAGSDHVDRDLPPRRTHPIPGRSIAHRHQGAHPDRRAYRTTPPADLVTAGFPCQDISYAGRGAGIERGRRSGLWDRIAGVLRQLRPGYVLVENVAALRTRGLSHVLANLAALGYDTQWTCLRASAIGAPHPRDHLFLLAHQSGRTMQLASAAEAAQPPTLLSLSTSPSVRLHT